MRFLSLLLLVLLAACGTPDAEPVEATTEETTTESAPPPPTAEKRDEYRSWVSGLKLRKTPSLDAEVIASLAENTALKPTGAVSGEADTYVLRGVAYEEPWIEVTTPEGQTGWVFGGALRRPGEAKGNAEISDTKLDFPVFGQYDLGDWGTPLVTALDEEEIDGTSSLYSRDDRYLEVEKREMGEFFYGYTYRLLDKNRNLLKEREFSFTADQDGHLLSEVVTDYTDTPNRRYTRSQTLDTHFYQLNAKPMMARGEWNENTL